MCLLLISYQTTPGYRLAVAANRDEFLVRPTAPLGFLDEQRSILGGRDLQGGGTWLGVSAGLRFAALTNYRDPAHNRADAPSRGELVLDFLRGSMPAEEYMQHLAATAQIYNGFNLIVGDDQRLFLLSNRSSGYQQLAPGYYGLSNHLLDTPWPKVVRGKELLRPHLQQRINVAGVFAALADRHLPEDHQLPDTGVGIAWERLLSTIFIAGDTYGTRSSALLTVSDAHQVIFREKTYAAGSGQGEAVRQLSFSC